MLFSHKKLFNIGYITFVLVMGIIISYTSDTLEPTRKKLEVFYEHEIDSCRVTDILTKKYPSRGYYEEIKIHCSYSNYPLLFAKSEHREIEIGNFISKRANSTQITVQSAQEKFLVDIRNPSEEDNRVASVETIILFFGPIIILMLFLPNSLFDRKK